MAEKKPLLIGIDTSAKTILFDGKALTGFRLAEIHKLLGHPSRIEKTVRDSYIEEFPLEKDEQRAIIPVKIFETYYIYDSLGLMFYAAQSRYSAAAKPKGSAEPGKLILFSKNRRMFTHTGEYPYRPKQVFSGELKINGETVDMEQTQVPAGIDYKTEEFTVYKVKFAPTSYTMQIDSIYSRDSVPALRIYLNEPHLMFFSYLEAVLGQ